MYGDNSYYRLKRGKKKKEPRLRCVVMGGCCVQKMKIMGQMNEEVEEDPEDLVLSMRFYSSIGSAICE